LQAGIAPGYFSLPAPKYFFGQTGSKKSAVYSPVNLFPSAFKFFKSTKIIILHFF
jgi:hypothetical protein